MSRDGPVVRKGSCEYIEPLMPFHQYFLEAGPVLLVVDANHRIAEYRLQNCPESSRCIAPVEHVVHNVKTTNSPSEKSLFFH